MLMKQKPCNTFFLFLFLFYACAYLHSVTLVFAGDASDEQVFLKFGVDVNKKDESGYTQLMRAAREGNLNLVKNLIQAGAEINARDTNGMNALLYAFEYNHFEICSFLIDKGADKEAKLPTGRTLLISAIWDTANLEAVKMLIGKGFDVNKRDEEGLTVLEYALSRKGGDAIAAELIKNGARLFEPELGKARIVFLAGDLFLNDGAWITIEEKSKWINRKSSIVFFDVDPGMRKITIPLSWPHKSPWLSMELQAGKTYYFIIDQNYMGRIAGTVTAGIGAAGAAALGAAIAAGTAAAIIDRSREKTHFELVLISEKEAREKIRTRIPF
ncbi:MAG: ankyrin repeat domain-containing protein [Smithella sp.]